MAATAMAAAAAAAAVVVEVVVMGVAVAEVVMAAVALNVAEVRRVVHGWVVVGLGYPSTYFTSLKATWYSSSGAMGVISYSASITRPVSFGWVGAWGGWVGERVGGGWWAVMWSRWFVMPNVLHPCSFARFATSRMSLKKRARLTAARGSWV